MSSNKKEYKRKLLSVNDTVNYGSAEEDKGNKKESFNRRGNTLPSWLRCLFACSVFSPAFPSMLSSVNKNGNKSAPKKDEEKYNTSNNVLNSQQTVDTKDTKDKELL